MSTCPNCGTAVAETYCPACGQKYEDERFTLGAVLSTALEDLVNLESGALATVVGLSWAPGRVVRDNWARCTKPYLNPAKYFLFAFTVFQLVLWQTGFAGGFVEGIFGASDDVSVSRAQALRFLGDYFVLFCATSLPFLTVASYWGTERNLAEHAIFQLYVAGHVALLWSLFFLVGELLSITTPVVELIVALAVLLAPVFYYLWAYVTAHQPDTGHSLGREILQGIGTLILFAVLYVFFLVFLIGLYEGIMNRGAS